MSQKKWNYSTATQNKQYHLLSYHILYVCCFRAQGYAPVDYLLLSADFLVVRRLASSQKVSVQIPIKVWVTNTTLNRSPWRISLFCEGKTWRLCDWAFYLYIVQLFTSFWSNILPVHGSILYQLNLKKFIVQFQMMHQILEQGFFLPSKSWFNLAPHFKLCN